MNRRTENHLPAGTGEVFLMVAAAAAALLPEASAVPAIKPLM